MEDKMTYAIRYIAFRPGNNVQSSAVIQVKDETEAKRVADSYTAGMKKRLGAERVEYELVEIH